MFMHDFFHTPLPQLLSQYGYIILFPAGVVAGPAAYLVAGALVASGSLNAIIVTIMLVAADLVGDAAYYSLGRWGHGPLVERIGKRLSLTPERLQPIEDRFRRNDRVLILIGKTQAFGAVVLYAAGATRMHFMRFLWWNMVATVPKIILFELVGYFAAHFFGQAVFSSRHAIDGITFVLFGGALLLLVAYWFSAKYLKGRSDRDTPSPSNAIGQAADEQPAPFTPVHSETPDTPKPVSVAIKKTAKPKPQPRPEG
jgi:membrane-associated protein